MSLFDRIFSTESSPPEEEADGIRLVVGLGNPGPEYENTRHNIGFALLDQMATSEGWKWSRERKLRAKVTKESSRLILAKPLTYMNLSGNAVSRIARLHRLRTDQILIVYDDVDLPIGKIRFRASGSAGGHNGIKSIIEYLGTKDFPRLKIGIGNADHSEGMVDHVLGRFKEEEWKELEKVLAIAEDGVNCAVSSGLDTAMNRFN